MPKEHINPTSLFPSVQYGFSQIVTARGGKTVYISGQTAWDAEKRIIGGKNLGEQTRQALRNIRTAVEAAGGNLTDVVSVRIYVVNYSPLDAGQVGERLENSSQGNVPPPARGSECRRWQWRSF